MSQESMNILNSMTQFRKEFYLYQIMKPFSDFYSNSMVNNPFGISSQRYPIYFDHRVADSNSSFTHVYELGRVCNGRKCIYLNSLLQNCKIEGLRHTYSLGSEALKFLEKCPPIPYRPNIREGKDAVRLITPDEFIAEYS